MGEIGESAIAFIRHVGSSITGGLGYITIKLYASNQHYKSMETEAVES